MGLNTETLGPPEQLLIRKMELVILATLRRASILLGHDTDLSMKYFGDKTPRWIFYLQVMLRRMASMLSIHEFELHNADRKDVNATHYGFANMPFGGWRDNSLGTKKLSFITCSQYRDFNISLGTSWYTAPEYYLPNYRCYSTKPVYPMPRIKEGRSSKFNIVIHELTHLVFYTVDIAYDYHECIELAVRSPDDAKRNAENWTYFIEHIWGLNFLNN